MAKLFNKFQRKAGKSRNTTSRIIGSHIENRTISRNNPTKKERPKPGPLPPKTGN